MLESITGGDPFLMGTVVGLGQGLGHILMRLVTSGFGLAARKTRGCAPAASVNTDAPGGESTEEKLGDAASDDEKLAQVVAGVKTEADWKNFVAALNESCIPFDASAARELA